MKLILTDIDDTLLDFNETFLNHIGVECDTIGEAYSFIDMIQDRDVDALITSFQQSEHFDSLKSLPWAKEGLTELYLDGYRFIGITAVENTPEMVMRRSQNLYREFGFEFEDVICVGVNGSKEEALKRFERTVWVDDHPAHYETGSRYHDSFLMKNRFNRHYHSTMRGVDDWRDITEHLGNMILEV